MFQILDEEKEGGVNYMRQIKRQLDSTRRQPICSMFIKKIITGITGFQMWAGSEHCREDETDRKPFSQKVGSLKCIFRKSDAWRLLKKIGTP